MALQGASALDPAGSKTVLATEEEVKSCFALELSKTIGYSQKDIWNLHMSVTLGKYVLSLLDTFYLRKIFLLHFRKLLSTKIFHKKINIEKNLKRFF